MTDEDDYSSVLGQNVVAARVANQLTQQELAEVAALSRATIAEIERGAGDPKLSTIVTLAKALNTTPLMLLMQKSSLLAASQIREAAMSWVVSPESVKKMEDLMGEKSEKNPRGPQPQQVAKEGIRALGAGGGAGVGAAIGSLLLPGVGTVLGAALGGLWGEQAASFVRDSITPDNDTQSKNPSAKHEP